MRQTTPPWRYIFNPVATELDLPAGCERSAVFGELWRNADGSLGFNAASTSRLVDGYLTPVAAPPAGYALITDAFCTEIYAKLARRPANAVLLSGRRARAGDTRGQEFALTNERDRQKRLVARLAFDEPESNLDSVAASVCL